LLLLIAKLELSAPLVVAVHPPWLVESDKEPEGAGEEGDIVDIDRPDDCARGKAANKRTLRQKERMISTVNLG
jgi:hypothetical protein